MIILDTDALSHVQRGAGSAYDNLAARLAAANDAVVVTVASFDEQVRGRLAQVARARTPAALIEPYLRLRELLDSYRTLRVFDLDELAANRLRDLIRQRLRIGTMDLRIAAIALSHGALLVSSNLRDFRKVSGLRVEDWTVAP